MLFEILQHVLRIKARVGIVEADDEAERYEVVLGAVDPGAAIFLHGERPAHGVNDFPLGDAAEGHLPELFHADPVGLRIAAFREIESVNELFGQRSASALGEDRDLGFEIVAGFEVRLGVILFIDAFVVGAHSGHAIAFIEKLRIPQSP